MGINRNDGFPLREKARGSPSGSCLEKSSDLLQPRVGSHSEIGHWQESQRNSKAKGRTMPVAKVNH